MDRGYDEELRDILEGTYQAALLVKSSYTPDQIKLMILATNLGSIANTFLLADSNPEVKLNLKQLALGILGTQDWITEGFETSEPL